VNFCRLGLVGAGALVRLLVADVPDGPGDREEETGDQHVRRPVTTAAVSQAGQHGQGEGHGGEHEEAEQHVTSMVDAGPASHRFSASAVGSSGPGACFMARVSESEHWRLDRIGSARAGTNPTVLAKLPQSYAVIGDTQYLPGYCVLLVDDPRIDRLTDLPKRARLEFLDSMDTLGQAVETACRDADPGFRRMNYEILGNTDAYLHAHLFPRYEWEPPTHVGRPVWLYDPREFYGPEAALSARHDELRDRIVTELAAP